MAKRKFRNKRLKTRDASAITSQRERFSNVNLNSFTDPRLHEDIRSLTSLRDLEDRRTNYPTSTDRPDVSLSNRAALVPHPSSGVQVAPHLGFDDARSVLVCIRRRNRRKMMFASGNAARSGQRKPRRNSNSKYRC